MANIHRYTCLKTASAACDHQQSSRCICRVQGRLLILLIPRQVSVRPVSVAALLREKEDADIFPEESDAVKRPGTVMGTLSGGLGSDSERDEGDRLDIPEPDTNGELSDEGPEGQLDEDPDNVRLKRGSGKWGGMKGTGRMHDFWHCLIECLQQLCSSRVVVEQVPFVEQRRVEVYVWEARDLPVS